MDVLDEALALKESQCLTHRTAAHLQVAGEYGLVDSCAGGELVVKDAATQFAADHLHLVLSSRSIGVDVAPIERRFVRTGSGVTSPAGGDSSPRTTLCVLPVHSEVLGFGSVPAGAR